MQATDQTGDAASQEGITAVIYLQAMAGITYTRAQALATWQSFKAGERAQTLAVYALVTRN